MKSITLIGRITTGIAISGLLMLGISSCTDKPKDVSGNVTVKQADVVQTNTVVAPTVFATPAAAVAAVDKIAAAVETPAGTPVVLTPAEKTTVATAIEQGVSVDSGMQTSGTDTATVVNTDTVTDPTSKVVLQVRSDEVPIETTGSGENTVATKTADNMVSETPLSSTTNSGGSNITTETPLVIPVSESSTISLGVSNSGGTFTESVDETSPAQIELSDESGITEMKRALTTRKRIYLCGFSVRVSNMYGNRTTMPTSQTNTIARETSTGVGTTRGSKLTLVWDNAKRSYAPLDGKVRMKIYFYNSLTRSFVKKERIYNCSKISLTKSQCVLTDDQGAYPQFTHMWFELDCRNRFKSLSSGWVTL